MGNANGLRCQWFATIGDLGRQRLRVLVPRPVSCGGKLPDSGSTIVDEKQRPDSGSTIVDEKQRPVPRLLYHASGTPPQRRRE